MKNLRFTVVSLLIATTSVVAAPQATAGELSLLGAKLTWSDKMYVSDVCSRYDFQYTNGTGIELLSLGFELNDPFGRNLTDWSETGIAPNKSGTWNRQICRSAFTNGVGPYIIKLKIKDYSSTQRQETKELYFLPLPTADTTPKVSLPATPSPAPTVYVSNPVDQTLTTLVATLTVQVKNLNAKLKRICSVKPKPKGC
jgi:hypothetical protein